MTETPPLTPGQMAALMNLARKQSGEDVGWINIADATALTDLGLAQRNREGWAITPAGKALADSPSVSACPESASITKMNPSS